jgi:hypothetical protein
MKLPQANTSAMRQQLSDGLRQTYEALVREPLPAEFLALIDKLDAIGEGLSRSCGTDAELDRSRPRPSE